MDILIDFDGTCVAHTFPVINDHDIGAISVLKELVKEGHNLILFTMRDNKGTSGDVPEGITSIEGEFLNDAIGWFDKHGIPLYGIQTHPTQSRWTTSPKAYGHLLIDDTALGCPLKFDKRYERPYVDWKKVRILLTKMGII